MKNLKHYLTLSVLLLLLSSSISAQITELPWNANFQEQDWISSDWQAPVDYSPIPDVDSNAVARTIENNLLISPHLHLPVSNNRLYLTISFRAFGPLVEVEVLVSTSGASDDDFVVVKAFEDNGIGVFSADLSDYMGEEIYLAFRTPTFLEDPFTLYLWNITIIENLSVITEYPWHENFNPPDNWIGEGWDIIKFPSTFDDTMLISPLLQLPATAPNNAMYLTYQTNYFDMEYEILVSTSGTNQEDFETIYTGNTWSKFHTLSLSEFDGQSIYISFRKTSQDSKRFTINNVRVREVVETISSFPYQQSFSNAYIPDGWLNDGGWSFGFSEYHGDWVSYGLAIAGIIDGSNDLLISPKFILPSNMSIQLNFDIRGDTEYEILVSTTGTLTDDFVGIHKGIADIDLWTLDHLVTMINFDISTYAGQDIYLAFRKTESGVIGLNKISISVLDSDVTNNDEIILPDTTTLYANYPNPFNPTTTISFMMAIEGKVSIDIYNIKGQKVKNLVDGLYKAGKHNVTWDGRDENGQDISTGLYFYRMNADNFSQTKKMIMVK